jgi:hypothetical protein
MSLPNVLNVGWLDQSMPFTKGIVPEFLLDRLNEWFRVGRLNQMRGIYQCNFCDVTIWPFPPLDGQKWKLPPLDDNPSINIGGKKIFLGNWELWVPSRDGSIFASPALIIHYILVHGYCPPQEFITAAMNDKAMDGWNAEAEFEKREKLV